MNHSIKSFLLFFSFFRTFITLLWRFESWRLVLLMRFLFFFITTFWSFTPFSNLNNFLWLCLFCLIRRLLFMLLNKILSIFSHLLSWFIYFFIGLRLFSNFLYNVSRASFFRCNFSLRLSFGWLDLRRSFVIIRITKCVN